MPENDKKTQALAELADAGNRVRSAEQTYQQKHGDYMNAQRIAEHARGTLDQALEDLNRAAQAYVKEMGMGDGSYQDGMNQPAGEMLPSKPKK